MLEKNGKTYENQSLQHNKTFKQSMEIIMEDKSKLGTIVDGIGASEHLDSSGEVLDIKGMDISSLGSADSILNFEHNSKDHPAQVCGKITFAKKIFKKSDCDNERQEYFWDICQKPFVYIKGELFDHPDLDHDGARNVAAILRYDNRDKGKKARRLISFSIEGGKMDKKGVVVSKSIARDVALTIKHCNKMCIAEILDDFKGRKDLYKNEEYQVMPMIKGGYRDIVLEDMKKTLPAQDSFKQKIDKLKNTNSFKAKQDSAEAIGKLASKPMYKQPESKPKREFTESSAPSTLKVGDRIKYNKPKMKTGRDIYSDPDTFKSDNNMRKAIVAGMMGGTPDSKTGTAALTAEDLDIKMQDVGIKSKKKPEKLKKGQPNLSFPKMGIENKPNMQVKQLDPDKTYTTKDGKEFSSAQLENKKLQNKFIQNEKQKVGAEKFSDFDKKSQNYLNKQKQRYANTIDPDNQGGANISVPEDNINYSYDMSGKGQSRKEMMRTKGRGNYPSTKHHEGLHHALSGIESQHSKQHSKNLIRHMTDNFFHPDDVKSLQQYVGKKYDKNDPHLKEELLTHTLDLLTNPEKRQEHESHYQDGGVSPIDYNRLKRSWLNTVKFAKDLDGKQLNKINNLYNKKDTAKKNKKVVIEKIPPGGHK